MAEQNYEDYQVHTGGGLGSLSDMTREELMEESAVMVDFLEEIDRNEGNTKEIARLIAQWRDGKNLIGEKRGGV